MLYDNTVYFCINRFFNERGVIILMKKIIHIDADCFYASVEAVENPKLTKLPLAVGGSPEKRGVIATCNYEARKYGVRSAMSSSVAIKLCPELKIVAPNMSLYKEYSHAMREIFNEYSERVEPLSLDEAYIDVSDSTKSCGSATLIAKEIRYRIYQDLGICVSAGVAPIKFLAKIASDWRKPNGLFVIAPADLSSFIANLSVGKLPGVGKVTREKLARYGIHTCNDVKTLGLAELIRHFGAQGSRMYEMSCGIDKRDVSPSRERKSISVEHTFSQDLPDIQSLLPKLVELNDVLHARMGDAITSGAVKGAFVKLKFSDFESTTAEARFGSQRLETSETFQRLACAAWQRKNLPIRLAGVGFRLRPVVETQLELPLEGCST